MALSASGVGSGLDVASIVSQLMSLESRPLDRLNTQEKELDAKLSAYGQLRSALSTFQSAMEGLSSTEKFQVFSAASTDETAFTATTNSTASAASYTVNVTTLAKEHKLASDAFADTDTTTVGTGTLSFTVGAGSFDVDVDASNNTLGGLRDAINDAANTADIDMTASIITDDTGSRLILTANDSGTANQIAVSAADDDTNNTDASGISQFVFDAGVTERMSESQAAVDSVITVDGFTVTSSSNTVTDAIEGVTLTLKDNTGVDETLTVARDISSVKDSVKTFVDAYNDIKGVMDILSDEGGTLQGDSGILSIGRLIQSEINTAASGLDYSYLAELGITTDSVTGDLLLDTTDLEAELSSNYSGVASFFANDSEGIAFRLDALATDLLSTDNLIDSREDGIKSSIDSVQLRQDNVELRLEIIEERYRAQFTALDGLIAQMNSTSSFLSQQLASLNNFT